MALGLSAQVPPKGLSMTVSEAPRPLSEQGLRNLVAFSRAMNYVRYFHPSDEAAKADWEALSAAGVRAVEGAGSPPELAQRLQTFLTPYAPSVQVLTTGQPPSVPIQPADAAYVIRWEHFGWEGHPFPGSVYHSERVYAPLAERAAKEWADPLSPSTLELGDDLRIWMPSVCFADAAKTTLPRAVQKAVLPASGVSTGDDRATRLGDVALAWGVFRHFYPYADVSRPDWDAELGRALDAAATDPDAATFVHTLKRFLASLKDGHARVYSEFDGGATPSLALVMVDGRPFVRYAGASAQTVPAGSELLTVDKEPVAARVARLRPEISAASEGWMNFRLCEDLVDGKEGSSVRLTFRSPKGTVAETTLKRDSNTWVMSMASRPDSLTELRPGIWYVDLCRSRASEIESALPKLTLAKGIVFDLRGYPREDFPQLLQHLSKQPLESARWNVPQVTQPDGRGWIWGTLPPWKLEPQAPVLPRKRVFLTNSMAISASESFLGIVEAYHLGEIVGDPTAGGTNGNTNRLALPGGYRIPWTGMRVRMHDGSRHQGVGIHPTLEVKPTAKGLAEVHTRIVTRSSCGGHLYRLHSSNCCHVNRTIFAY